MKDIERITCEIRQSGHSLYQITLRQERLAGTLTISRERRSYKIERLVFVFVGIASQSLAAVMAAGPENL